MKCLYISSPEGECITPTIYGFTIQFGKGSLAKVDTSTTRIGGGIYSNNAAPSINYNLIQHNKNSNYVLEYAGALSMGDDVGVERTFRQNVCVDGLQNIRNNY